MEKKYSAAYQKYIHNEIKLPSKKKGTDRHDKMNYWPTSIKDVINWSPFMNIMEYTSYRIENEIMLLPS